MAGSAALITKYSPLAVHLRAGTPPVRMTFDEVGSLVGGLPPSAYRHPAWWENSPSHVQAAAWLEQGWRAVEVDLLGQVVMFGRA